MAKIFSEITTVRKGNQEVQVGKTDLIRSGAQLDQLIESVLPELPDRLRPQLESHLENIKSCFYADPQHQGKLVMALGETSVEFWYEATGVRTGRQVAQTVLGVARPTLRDIRTAFNHDPLLTTQMLRQKVGRKLDSILNRNR